MSYNNQGYDGFSGSFGSSGFPFLDSQPQEMETSGPAGGHEGSSGSGGSNSGVGHGESASSGSGSGQHQQQQNVFSDEVSFQIPHFIYSSTPNLATGGGVEVFPLGMPTQSWIANSGFRYNDRLSDNSLGKKPAYDFERFEEPPIADPSRDRIAPALPPPPASAATTAASQTLGLPIYSATGFDLLSVLARVATRPNPRVPLGPVDMSCSFVVTDTRRHDHPIIYCSPNFLELTGYSESEILGRNCRFLQSPCGLTHGQRGAVLGPGDPRPDAATSSAAWHLKKCLDADKEVQVVITNYKKDGTPFTNHVTIIPVPGGVSGAVGEGEENDVVFQVGFQVDLTEQPSMILEKLKNGSYLVDYSTQNLFQGKSNAGPLIGIGGLTGLGAGGGPGTRERRTTLIPKITISKQMKRLLNDPGFVRSIHITHSMLNQATPAPPPSSTSSPSTTTTSTGESSGDIYGGNHPLHLMLLETGPDFVHVVSLKGTFLYVAPSVRNILGYEPEDLAGKSISDLAHPEDVVPLMRELKESSTTGISAAGTNEGALSSTAPGNSPTISTASPSSVGTGGSTTTSNIASNVPITSGHAPVQPRTVDLLFRARTKNGAYVWVESRGRLHVEPGKGRKAIILSGRAREIPRLKWSSVIQGGGLAKSVKRRVLVPSSSESGSTGEMVEEVDVLQEFWATVSPSMVLLMLGGGFEDVLGLNPEEWKGRSMKRILDEAGGGGGLEGIIKNLSASAMAAHDGFDDEDENRMDEDTDAGSNRRNTGKGKQKTTMKRNKDHEAKLVQTQCRMRHRDGRFIDVIVNVFKCERDPKVVASTRKNPGGITPAPLILQVRLVGAEMYALTPTDPSTISTSSARRASVSSATTANGGGGVAKLLVDPEANMFEELEISRGSSWQYELQQLKYANQRLKDDIKVLEAAMKGNGIASTPGSVAPSVGPSVTGSANPAGSGQSNMGGGGMRSSFGGGNESGSSQMADPWAMPTAYFSSAQLPARPSTGRPSHHVHQMSSHYEPPTPLAHEYDAYIPTPSAQPQQTSLSSQQAAAQSLLAQHTLGILHHPRHPSTSNPQSGNRTVSTPISMSTPASGLPSLTDWPSSAGLGPSPFVQRIQQEAMNNPGGVSVSVSVPVNVRAGGGGDGVYGGLMKRSWGGADGPSGSR